MGLNRFAKGFFDPLIELYRPVPPLAWAPLIISVLGIDNTGKVFLLFMVSLSIMIISARAGASGTHILLVLLKDKYLDMLFFQILYLKF